jgi:hypothetical protein
MPTSTTLAISYFSKWSNNSMSYDNFVAIFILFRAGANTTVLSTLNEFTYYKEEEEEGYNSCNLLQKCVTKTLALYRCSNSAPLTG